MKKLFDADQTGTQKTCAARSGRYFRHHVYPVDDQVLPHLQGKMIFRCIPSARWKEQGTRYD